MQSARPAHEPVRLEPARCKRFGQLVRDERTADRNPGGAAIDLVRNGTRVVEILKREQVRSIVGAGLSGRIGTSTGRDEQRIVWIAAAVAFYNAVFGNDALDARTQMQVDPLFFMPR